MKKLDLIDKESNEYKAFIIGNRMLQQGADIDLIAMAIKMTSEYVGLYELMVLWDEETEVEEQELIMEDMITILGDIVGSSHHSKMLKINNNIH